MNKNEYKDWLLNHMLHEQEYGWDMSYGNSLNEAIYMIDDIQGVARSETMISMEEAINDKRRLLHKAFREL